ncbi:peptidoglycan DD-metalloendopeptidase family protein [Rhodomicrobium sp. Az07]|uniref:LysM peptidoglycan-binding domain-containing M23 family metallopeptidase n=1 Tax=Rhodomicrobium sp. Az07 TaxID=2839034 RepID=UPI001BE8ABFD|nr:LysM peptidoglycan-binding domain-containing M23 family metallopeptidase [Rhodomicrobium sp. Az07]MBT3069995.1 peptidoglycan DD-metalloendopeptidase family protein [Rhodomicrobium sp. Az07]
MSKVNAVGKREPSYVRAVLKIGVGCVLLGGCSSGGTERFSSLSFGSGYETASGPSTPATPSRAAEPSRQPTGSASYAQSAYAQRASQTQANYQTQPAPMGYAQTAAYRPNQQGGFQLASATPGQQQGGYLQVSRVDLPPLAGQQQTTVSKGVKTADGYGRYNQAPLPDGTYAGPRVYTPYNDGPRDYAPPPPPPPPLDAPRYERDAPPPPAYDDRRSEAAPPHDRPLPRYAEPAPRSYSPPPRDYSPPPPAYPRDRDFYERERVSRLGRNPGGNGTEIKSPNATVASERGTGKSITVRPGDTLYSLAIRHGVTVDMIARANGLGRHNSVRPGMDLLIPGADPTKMTTDNALKAQPVGCQGNECHVVKKGETVAAIARGYGLTASQILEANHIPNARLLKIGQTLAIPGREAPRQEVASNDRVKPEAPIAEPQRQADAQPAPEPAHPQLADATNPLKAAPAPDVKMTSARQEPTCEAALANPLPRMGKSFRKPVEGMIIGQFGPQHDGSVNEGVTISVPKGTPIKAAENGVVAYVGDELPGFGNLILIRHADEFVTAYAHTDEIMVRKCDVVKRGQVVAKAGSTGDASQPQLHFEIRKNAKPVDPAPLLGS